MYCQHHHHSVAFHKVNRYKPEYHLRDQSPATSTCGEIDKTGLFVLVISSRTVRPSMRLPVASMYRSSIAGRFVCVPLSCSCSCSSLSFPMS